MYKIISMTSSYIERAITFSVDGKVDRIVAPSRSKTFDDLKRLLDEKYGGAGSAVKSESTKKADAPATPVQTAPAVKTATTATRKRAAATTATTTAPAPATKAPEQQSE